MKKAVERRLGRALHAARSFLQRAAVTGRQLDLSLLHEPGEDTHALALACAEAGILEVTEQAWRFSHDKLRERLLADHTDAKRHALHLGLAWRISAAHPEDPLYAGRAAYHFREAGEWAKAEANFTRAAESALRRGASAEAEALFGHAHALQRLISVSRLQRVRVLRGLSEARFAQGKLREADLSLRSRCEAAALPLPETALDWPKARLK